MNDKDGVVFNYLGKEYFLPKQIIKENCHPFDSNDFGYTTCYFFKKRKKMEVSPTQQKPQYTVTSKKKYEKDTFYKLTQISKTAKYFDYFMKLKDDCNPNVMVESNCHNFFRKKIDLDSNITKTNGKFVVKFQ